MHFTLKYNIWGQRVQRYLRLFQAEIQVDFLHELDALCSGATAIDASDDVAVRGQEEVHAWNHRHTLSYGKAHIPREILQTRQNNLHVRCTSFHFVMAILGA